MERTNKEHIVDVLNLLSQVDPLHVLYGKFLLSNTTPLPILTLKITNKISSLGDKIVEEISLLEDKSTGGASDSDIKRIIGSNIGEACFIALMALASDIKMDPSSVPIKLMIDNVLGVFEDKVEAVKDIISKNSLMEVKTYVDDISISNIGEILTLLISTAYRSLDRGGENSEDHGNIFNGMPINERIDIIMVHSPAVLSGLFGINLYDHMQIHANDIIGEHLRQLH